MPVVVSAFDVVVRVDAFAGGAAAFAALVPNATFCTDNVIARASFMNAADREHFVAQLPPLGADALMRIEKALTSVDAPWLERGRHSGVDAVWKRGAPSDPLVVPVHWKPAQLEFLSWEEMKEHLEYEGVDNGVEVYRDKRTGKTLYAGRARPAVDEAQSRRIEELRREASAALEGLLPKILARQPLGFFEKRRVEKARARYEEIVAVFADDWSARWMLGMIARAFGEQPVAREHFRRAYGANPAHRDVGREYAAQCMIVGDGAEGVRVSRELHARFPEDAGLQSNLALALLIGGDLDEALAVAQAAHDRDRADTITKNLLHYIVQVKAGRVARPTRMPGT